MEIYSFCFHAHTYLSTGARVEESCMFADDKYQPSQGSPRTQQTHLLVGEKKQGKNVPIQILGPRVYLQVIVMTVLKI